MSRALILLVRTLQTSHAPFFFRTRCNGVAVRRKCHRQHARPAAVPAARRPVEGQFRRPGGHVPKNQCAVESAGHRALPSGENARQYTLCPPSSRATVVSPCSTLVHLPVARSQNLMVPSPPEVASSLPFGLNATDTARLLCAFRVATVRREATSQSTIAPSGCPIASVFPSGLKATHWAPRDTPHGRHRFPSWNAH